MKETAHPLTNTYEHEYNRLSLLRKQDLECHLEVNISANLQDYILFFSSIKNIPICLASEYDWPKSYPPLKKKNERTERLGVKK